MEENKEEIKLNESKLKELVAKGINNIIEDGIQADEIDTLGKLVDIHKDLANEEYWQKKKEDINMRYNYDEYNEYGRRGVPGTGRRNYGRRGVPGTGRGRYRGEDTIEEMQEMYDNYNEANEEVNRGNYGAENDMVKSVDGIMRNICEIVEELADSGNPEVMHIIKKHTKKISEMI